MGVSASAPDTGCFGQVGPSEVQGEGLTGGGQLTLKA